MLPDFEIRILMLRAGFGSQKELADRIGIHPQTLSALFKGKRHTKKHLAKIAKVLHCRIGYLCL